MNKEIYYGKELKYVITELKNGVITHRTESQRVYNPKDLNNKIGPCSGCDIVIGHNSTNSKYIYEEGNSIEKLSPKTYLMFGGLTVFNYCLYQDMNTVIKLQREAILVAVNEALEIQKNSVKEITEFLKTV